MYTPTKVNVCIDQHDILISGTKFKQPPLLCTLLGHLPPLPLDQPGLVWTKTNSKAEASTGTDCGNKLSVIGILIFLSTLMI